MVRFVFPVLLLGAMLAMPVRGQAPSRVDVVALMVEFQPDTTRFTTGDGTFGGVLFEGVDAPSIDPLPHNSEYFEAHLRFLEHYVDRVSDGRTQVVTHLLPQTVRVPEVMGTYSPTGVDAGSDEELTKLAQLIDDAWSAADEYDLPLPAGIDPENTAFILFHAGVGRDIELVGTTLDKTPEDLPSIYLDDRTLGRLGVDNVSVSGLPVSNTMVIPRTESRLGVDPLTSEPFLIELSINGLLAASFFNYLGVPDLFNTGTGDSAIGPFGLMDALGIFAYSGLFPPEPSAWTKQFLGWHDDGVQVGGSGTIQLRHAGSATRNEMARIPISTSEYFLVENRHRDPDDDGVRLRVWTHEGEQDVVFQNGDTEFNDQTVSGFPGGVVLSVDDYDFALPGGVDENDNPLLGGILIWHVDENRLRDGLAENRVNADPDRRAIDLEEADGAQDIGYASGASFFGPRFDLGTPFDFWFEGNPVTVRTSRGQDIRLYQNRFSADTEPSSYNNAGGQSGVALSNFSAVGPLMSFDYTTEQAGLLTFSGTTSFGDLAMASTLATGYLLTDAANSSVWAWVGDRWADADGCAGDAAPIRPVAVSGGIYVLSDAGFFRYEGNTCERKDLAAFTPAARTWTTPALEWIRLPGENRFYAGLQDGQGASLIIWIEHDDGRLDEARIAFPDTPRFLVVAERTTMDVLVITDAGVRDVQGSMLVAANLEGISDVAMAGNASDWTLGWTSASAPSRIHFLTSEGESTHFDVYGGCSPSHLAWHDVDQNGELDLTFACGASVQAVHRSGALLDRFPVAFKADITAAPVFARDAQGRSIMVAPSENGYLEGYVADGSRWSVIPGFPVSAGPPSRIAPLFAGGMMTALGSDGAAYWWQFDTRNATYAADAGLMVGPPDEPADGDAGSRLLVGSETYNWPNPIVSGSTRIRFEVQEASIVLIDIVDMGGVLIDQLEVASALAGVPTEVIWQTDVGSGIYMARVKARALAGGTSDTRLIRMAVIR